MLNLWKVTIYRTDSHTPVIFERVKHAWWEGSNYVIAQYDEDLKSHHYWTYPDKHISHVHEARYA